MPCLSCDFDAVPLDRDWVLRTNKDQANLGHMPCKAKSWDSMFTDVFVNYKTSKISCQECYLEVPKSVLDKAMFREQIEKQKECYKQEIDRRLEQFSHQVMQRTIISGPDIEKECNEAIKELRNSPPQSLQRTAKFSF